MTAPAQPLRQRVRDALHAVLHAAVGDPYSSTGLVAIDQTDAVLAAVQPDLDARDAEIQQLRAERSELALLLGNSERRRESTLVEARRQAARADTAEQHRDAVAATAHELIYHHGGPACPYPDTCPAASRPTT